MSGALEAWIETYGIAFVFAATFVSCLGAPIPALVVMLAAGAAAAAGGVSPLPASIAALAGALMAGNIVFFLGRTYGTRAVTRLERQPGWGTLVARAHATHERWGSAAVFIGASFVAQLGPAVNVIAGAAELDWWRFHLGHVPGRIIWVTTYIVLGYVFADNFAVIAGWAANASWFVVGVLILIGVLLIWRRARG